MGTSRAKERGGLCMQSTRRGCGCCRQTHGQVSSVRMGWALVGSSCSSQEWPLIVSCVPRSVLNTLHKNWTYGLREEDVRFWAKLCFRKVWISDVPRLYPVPSVRLVFLLASFSIHYHEVTEHIFQVKCGKGNLHQICVKNIDSCAPFPLNFNIIVFGFEKCFAFSM